MTRLCSSAFAKASADASSCRGPGGPRINMAELSARLAFRADAVCAALLPLGRAQGGLWIEAKRSAGGLGDSLQVHLAGDKRGRWSHYASGAHGDLIDLAQYVRGLDTGEAITWARGVLGLVARDRRLPGERAARRPERLSLLSPDSDSERLRRRERAQAIWQATAPLEGTLGARYLRARGIDPDALGLDGAWPEALRFHSSLWHPLERIEAPAIVARVDAADGGFAGVWRIYLARDGKAKAPVEAPRLGLGPTWGGAVRLIGPAREPPGLVVGEGVETSLSLAARQPGWALWSLMSANNLAGFAAPAGFADLIVAADHDPAHSRADGSVSRPGQDAARACVKRHRARGLRATAIMPGLEGSDFNDLTRAAARGSAA